MLWSAARSTVKALTVLLAFLFFSHNISCTDKYKKLLRTEAERYLKAEFDSRKTDTLNLLDGIVLRYYKQRVFSPGVKKVTYLGTLSRLNDSVFLLSIMFPLNRFLALKILYKDGRISSYSSRFLMGNHRLLKDENLRFYYWFPEEYAGKNMLNCFKEMKSFVEKICKSVPCPSEIEYIIVRSDSEFLYDFGGGSVPGIIFSKEPCDTLKTFLNLFEGGNKYLAPFLKAYYVYSFTSHEYKGYDLLDWLYENVKSRIYKGVNFSDFFLDTANNFVPAYAFVRYLSWKKGLTHNKLLKTLVSLDTFENRIVENHGDFSVFTTHYMFRLSGAKSKEAFLDDIYKFLLFNTRSLPVNDTLHIVRDSVKTNITAYISTLYGRDGEKVFKEFTKWLRNRQLFYYPRTVIIIAPFFEKSNLNLNDRNVIWVGDLEYLGVERTIDKLKLVYLYYWLNRISIEYTVSPDALPLWFSLALPQYLSNDQNDMSICISDYSSVVYLGKEETIDFMSSVARPPVDIYEDPDIAGILLMTSGLMLKKIDLWYGKGVVQQILEKSVSSIDFRSAFEAVTGKDFKSFKSRGMSFIEDTLFYYTWKAKI